MHNCLIIAGEKSGEEHTLSFLPQLRQLCPQTHFWGVGGEELKSCGMELIYHLKDFSNMGFSGVIGKIPFYLKAMRTLVEEVEKRQCRVAILVDCQDFNLRMAQRLSDKGVKVLYFVAPQAWAWRAGRAKKLAKYVHTLFTILPFEKKWFSDRGVKNTIAVPHPLITRYRQILEEKDAKLSAKTPHGGPGSTINILLLPGSRDFEVELLLPRFWQSIQELKKEYPAPENIKVSLVKASALSESFWSKYSYAFDQYYPDTELAKALEDSHVALASSGTVTLACALFQVPT
ncbi:MAG: hypothetical protein WCG27_13580, partial [Pseudomonadota bacterium]